MDNGNEIKAYDSIEKLKNHIIENYESYEVLDFHSGILNGIRYYGEGGYGTRVSIDALDHFAAWWDSDWDEEVYEL